MSDDALKVSNFTVQWAMPDCGKLYIRGTAHVGPVVDAGDTVCQEVVLVMRQEQARRLAISLVDALTKAKGPGVYYFKDALNDAAAALHRKAVNPPSSRRKGKA